MDKENKDIVTANNASYDPDAAELLKDLEDEDDDYEPELGSSQARRSIVSILNSSSNLESLATSPSLPSVSQAAVLADAPSSQDGEALASASDFEEPPGPPAPPEIPPLSSADAKVSSPNHSRRGRASAGIAAIPRDSAPESRPAYPPVPSLDTASGGEDDGEEPDQTDPSLPPVRKSKSAIKPFEPKAAEAKNADPVRPAEKAEKLVRKHDDAEKIADDSDLGGDRQYSGTRKPPVPPPPVTPSMTMPGRVLREGEIIVTQEALNDILPGGKNDDARDMASFKFADNNWYAQVFNEDFFRTVPKSSPRQTLREAKFIIDRLGIESGARVLDLCCGFGRHTIELAKKGFDMVGFDLSMVMLKRALADAQAQGQAIKFVHGDMRKLSFKAIFDAIYNVQTSFGYFDDQSNFKVLQGVFNALKPGGVFLIETVNRDFLVNDLPLRLWWKGVDCTLLEEIDGDAASGLLKIQRSFVFDDGRAPWEQKIQIRLYAAHEMRALLSRAGFRVVELSGDYSLPGAYFGATSPMNIFVAEKPLK